MEESEYMRGYNAGMFWGSFKPFIERYNGIEPTHDYIKGIQQAISDKEKFKEYLDEKHTDMVADFFNDESIQEEYPSGPERLKELETLHNSQEQNEILER